MKVSIRGIRVIDEPKPRRNGDMVIVNLDFSLDFLSCEGAVLVKLATGGLTVWPPMVVQTKEPRSIRLSRDAREAIATEAFPVFETLTRKPVAE
ncbi:MULTISPECIES: hypothetical protein [unclassified Mameliella]|uniref:hypothetical protein n=1 Tax=unclassified Mameliella TaxID=2630630 RepID=UPI00273EF0DB|nr:MULTISPECIES: hypothetical protein [unclassified Mameliella]